MKSNNGKKSFTHPIINLKFLSIFPVNSWKVKRYFKKALNFKSYYLEPDNSTCKYEKK